MFLFYFPNCCTEYPKCVQSMSEYFLVKKYFIKACFSEIIHSSPVIDFLSFFGGCLLISSAHINHLFGLCTETCVSGMSIEVHTHLTIWNCCNWGGIFKPPFFTSLCWETGLHSKALTWFYVLFNISNLEMNRDFVNLVYEFVGCVQIGPRNDCLNHAFGPNRNRMFCFGLFLNTWKLGPIAMSISCSLAFELIFLTLCIDAWLGKLPCLQQEQTDRSAEVSLSHSRAPLLVREEWGHPARGERHNGAPNIYHLTLLHAYVICGHFLYQDVISIECIGGDNK